MSSSPTQIPQRSRDVLDYLRGHMRSNSSAPSVREIGAALGMSSPATVKRHLDRLVAAGLLKRTGVKQSRSIELTRKERKRLRDVIQIERPLHLLPNLGLVGAGTGVISDRSDVDEADFCGVPETLTASGEDFVVDVRGDSMIEAGIIDGDRVVIHPCQEVRNGAIALVDYCDEDGGEWQLTIKSFYRDGNRVRLQPENSELEPIYPVDCKVKGRVVGSFRSYR
jgi:repressor LexA